MAQKADLSNSFKNYLPLLMTFIVIVVLSLVLTQLAENNLNLLTLLAVSSKNWSGAISSLFANYKMSYAISNLIGLSVYFLLFILANAFLSREEKRKRYLFFSIAIFVAGILANIFFLITGFLVPVLRGNSTGTSALIYSIEGAAFAFAVFNILSIRTIGKHNLVFVYFWLTFNLSLIMLPSFDLFLQLSKANLFFFGYGVNVFVHYYGFAFGFIITLVWSVKTTSWKTNKWLKIKTRRLTLITKQLTLK